MRKPPKPLDLKRIKVYPLKDRASESGLLEILIDPDSKPPVLPAAMEAAVRGCAKAIAGAHKRQAGVMLLYGAHLIKNGGFGGFGRRGRFTWLPTGFALARRVDAF